MARPSNNPTLKSGESPSRKEILKALPVGESVFFYGEPGGSTAALQRGIAGAFRAGESMSQQGLTQAGGIMVFEGELPTPVTRVTRMHEAKDF